MKSYREATYWKKYQAYFPEEFRCPDPNPEPSEEAWDWRQYRMHLDRIEVPQAPLKVIIVHGGGGYGRFLSPLAICVSRLGYEVVAPDLPGYGLTEPRLSDLDYAHWVEALSDLVDAEIARDGRGVVLFGLSLGGMLCYQVAARNPRVRGVVATTLADPREPEVRKRLTRFEALSTFGMPLMKAFSGLLDGLPIPMGLFAKMNAMSRDRAFNALVQGDELGGANWVPARFLRTLVETQPDLEPERFTTPLLLAHPQRDEWTELALSEPFYDRLAGPKRKVILENCGHAPIESPGIFQLQEAIAAFLGERVAESGVATVSR